MAKGKLPSLAAHVRKVSSYADSRSKFWDLNSEFWAIDRDGRRPRSDSFIQCVNSLCESAEKYPQFWQHAEYLVARALRDYPRISFQQKVAWLDMLSKGERHNEVRRGLEFMVMSGNYVAAEIVLAWVEKAMEWFDREGHKAAALMLLVGDRRYMDESALPTGKLVDYLELTCADYDQNHAVFRFFAILALRMEHMPESSPHYPACVEKLAEALYQVARHDERFFEALSSRMASLSPKARKAVMEKFLGYIDQEIGLIQQTKARATGLIEPSTA